MYYVTEGKECVVTGHQAKDFGYRYTSKSLNAYFFVTNPEVRRGGWNQLSWHRLVKSCVSFIS
jgi:hypothetical protein